MQRFIVSVAVGLGMLVPAFALAQTSSTGLLTVYVLVSNQNGLSYSPGNFTVSVAGNSPSLSSFSGSQSGTPISIYPGSYSVTANPANGYTPSYSAGCSNSIVAGQSQTCVITMSYTAGYVPAANYYPYPYQSAQPFSCYAATPSVALGQNARFEALGGMGGAYNWSTPFQNYPNVGPVLTVSFSSSGSQLVTVTNGARTATCAVTVSNTYNPAVVTPGYTSYPAPYYTAGSAYYPSYPALPRAGFAPQDLGLSLALAAVLLIAAGVATAPYARKAFAIVAR
jgi:hypothetical protein